MFHNSLSVGQLLGQETSSGKHGKTSVLQLLVLHGQKGIRLRGLQAKRIESQVTRGVVRAQEARLVDRDVTGRHPAVLGTVELELGDGNGQNSPERSRDLGKVADGRSRDLGIEKEGRSLNFLTDEETNGGQHGNTSVGKFGLAVSLQGVGVGLVSESEGIKDTDRGKSSRDGVNREGL